MTVHVVQLARVNGTSVALCCDGSVRFLEIDTATSLFYVPEKKGDACGPGCAWVMAKQREEGVERQKAILESMKAAQATNEKSVDIAEANQATLRDATRVELLGAYRSAFVSADDIFRRNASRMESVEALDEAVLAWEKKRMDG